MSVYRAKVLDNDDPSQLGRVKVEVYPMLLGKETALDMTDAEGIDIDVLPWAVPAFSLFTGAGVDFGSFCVPSVGSFVFVFFENNDVYQPVYFAEAADGIHGLPSERTQNYPYRKTLKTENGIVIELDASESDPEIKITHPEGTTFTIDEDGNVLVSGAGNITINADGNINVNSGGTINLNG